MKKSIFLFLLVSLFANSPIAHADPYFKGKVISMMVGFAPGGGYDLMSRILAKHLPKYIPGKPVIIVQNLPGASGVLVANNLYNTAKPDGLTIGVIDRGLPLAQLLKSKGVKYDMRKFAWVGSMAVETTIMALRSSIPYKNFNDVLHSKTPIFLGCTGVGDSAAQFDALLQEFAGLKANLVTYHSSADEMLAIERNEIDGRSGSYSALKRYIANGLIRPFVRGSVSEPGIENLPIDESLVSDTKAKTIMALRSSSGKVGRPFIAAPGTPEHIMVTLRDAFAKAAKDPNVQEEAQKMMIRIEYLPAKDCLDVMNFIMNQPDSIVNEASKYIKF